MHKKNFLFIGVAFAVVAIVISLIFNMTGNDAEITSESFPELEFTYTESNSKLKQNLESVGISMSSPVKLVNKNYLQEFCSFFEDVNMQKQVEYCTSTELLDSDGDFLGNIHMVGSRQMPKIVLVLIQTDPFMQDLDEIKSVLDIAIDNLVCKCWEDLQPSGILTVDEWVEKLKDFHTNDVKPTSKSGLNLMGMKLEMELTTNTEGYLWKLLISG